MLSTMSHIHFLSCSLLSVVEHESVFDASTFIQFLKVDPIQVVLLCVSEVLGSGYICV